MPQGTQSSLTDEDLILAFQNGDVASFEEIVRRYRDPLFNFVVRLLGDAFYSEDVVQETSCACSGTAPLSSGREILDVDLYDCVEPRQD